MQTHSHTHTHAHTQACTHAIEPCAASPCYPVELSQCVEKPSPPVPELADDKETKRAPNNITSDNCVNPFKPVPEKETDTEDEDTFQDGEKSFLNQPISEEEVLTAVSTLKTSKSYRSWWCCWRDMSYTGDSAVDFLVKLLNAGFDEGLLPDNWTKSISPPSF